MKRLENFMTCGIQAEVDPLLVINLIRLVNALFGDFPYDMLVFEPNEQGVLQVRLSGFSFETNELNEETIICSTVFKYPRKFWWKVDDYGDRYVGTFLFPEEY